MAASMTPEKAKEVASLPKAQGCLKLARHLGWDLSNFSDDVNMRESILLEYLHDNLMFALDHGFPWCQVCSAMELAREIQQHTVGQPLSHAIKLYRQMSSEYSQDGRISDNNMKILTSHIFSTFMRHYRLYQFVFTKPRSPMVTQHGLEVQPPPDVFELKDSQQEHIWEYDQKLAAIELEEQTRMAVLREESEGILEDEADFEKPLDTLHMSLTEPLQRENVCQAIREASNLQGSYTERLLQAKVEETQEDLDYYFEKTALPRPAALGPPPRTKKPAARTSAKSKAASIKSGVPSGGKKGDQSKGSAKSSRSKTPKSIKS